MASHTSFKFGDRVRHRKRPEWGIGSVVKTEEVTVSGQHTQRVSVRFPNAGLKTLSTAHAELEPAGGDDDDSARPTIDLWDGLRAAGWQTPMAQRKISEVMASLPIAARDPFGGPRQQLRFTLDLYRFDRSGRGLMDWAVAQSGLDDPLTRFTRQELEQLFERWAVERDVHLRKLIDESQNDPAMVRELLAQAPPGARDAVRRITSGR
jgi:hypothetical protein